MELRWDMGMVCWQIKKPQNESFDQSFDQLIKAFGTAVGTAKAKANTFRPERIKYSVTLKN